MTTIATLGAIQVPGGSPDGIWDRSPDDVVQSRAALRTAVAGQSAVVRLNRSALDGRLAAAPMEDVAGSAAVFMSLPLPDGRFGRFRIEESPILEPHVAAAFPEIRTYRGVGVDDPAASARFDWTPTGFHAIVLGAGGTVYVDPLSPGDLDNYLSIRQADLTEQSPHVCLLRDSPSLPDRTEPSLTLSGGTVRRTYRLALAATGEYTQAAGATKTLALARMTTTMNRVNGIYEREIAVRLTVSTGTAADPTALIFTDAATDPYTNEDGSAMLGQNQTKLDSVIGSANYDIGHVFSTGGGGIASLGSVCSSGIAGLFARKAQGVTGLPNPVGDPFDVDFVAHEMGHQFGGNHTFNATSGNCTSSFFGVFGTRSGSHAYEVGSGSTIMAYAGICSPENLQSHSDPNFSVESLNEITTFLSTGGGASCGTTASTGNSAPSVNAGASYKIPQLTPFQLTATGSDANGDTLTYSWEEYDLGSASSSPDTAATDDGSRPLFRPYAPTSSAVRTFPSLPFILKKKNVPPSTYSGSSEVSGVTCSGSSCVTGEVLPSTNRTMNFQVTARDNRTGGGGVASAGTQITVTTSAGPFQVTEPNTNVKWAAASTQTVKWDVANTTGAGINTSAVKISLSTDGGTTFPTVLSASTGNTGSADVVIPNSPTKTARIKVEAIGNIYFDISNEDFEIGDPTVSLALVVDDTGSMSEEIAAVRASLTNTITRLASDATTSKKPFPTVAIITFKDDTTTRVISNVPATLQSVVNSLVAGGGADCPEASNAALIKAGELLSKEGVAMLFTDADSRPDGPDRAAVMAVYRPKNIRLSVLLSGTCSGGLKSAGPSVDSGLGYSDNHDDTFARVADPSPASATLGTESALRTFTELSVETGGLFAAIPEVNSSSSSDGTTKYTNVATNLSVSTVAPAVALVAPSSAPQGGTVVIDITGSNTNFQGTSVVTVSGSGVSVGSPTVVSPTRLRVTLTIAASATLGFRDVSVTTNLGAGTTETALGGGSFQVTGPRTSAEILGITPDQVAQGKTTDLTISGINTSFSSSSSVALGSGLTVNRVTRLSATALQVNVTVAATATIGYRDVTVTTGSQVARESVLGPLLVTAPPPVVPRINTAAPGSAKRGRQAAVTITAENTHFATGTSTVTFGGTGVSVSSITVLSATSIQAIVSISQTAVLGFRDVTVTTGSETAVLLKGFNVTDPAAYPGALVFGATKNGGAGALVVTTPSQEVTVSYSGISSKAAWTATADKPWAKISGGTGTGAGRFVVSISDPSNSIGAQTDITALVTISVPSASITETVPVRLLVQQSATAGAAPFGQIDTPEQNASGVVGALSVTGWAADDVGIKLLKIYRQCVAFEAALRPTPCENVQGFSVVFLGPATFISGARPDVEILYPAMPAINRSGWGFMVLTNMLPHIPTGASAGGQGTFTIYAFAIDEDGHTTLLGRTPADHTPTTVTVANDSIAKPFGSIDTPGQGATVDGATYANFGWVVTPDPGTGVMMPLNGSTITVFIDGAASGNVTFNQCRGTVGSPPPAATLCNDDVSTLFRGSGARFRNLDAGRGAIGYRLLDTTALTNGIHTISWGVVDSAGRAEGLGSRFFTVLNASTSGLSVAPEAPDASKPLIRSGLYGRTGFDLSAESMPLPVNDSGVTVARIQELDRLELEMAGVVRGVLLVNGAARALPAGLRVDPALGLITWAPGPGYVGTYHFAFEGETNRILVDVTVGARATAPGR